MGKQKNFLGKAKVLVIIAYVAAAILAGVGVFLMTRGDAAATTMVVVAIWVALFAFMLGKEIKKKQEDQENLRKGLVKVTNIATEYLGKDHRTIEAIFRNHGFHNVTSVNLQDLKVIMVSKPGATQSVTIDGKEVLVNEWYHPDAKVEVIYHGFAE